MTLAKYYDEHERWNSRIHHDMEDEWDAQRGQGGGGLQPRAERWDVCDLHGGSAIALQQGAPAAGTGTGDDVDDFTLVGCQGICLQGRCKGRCKLCTQDRAQTENTTASTQGVDQPP